MLAGFTGTAILGEMHAFRARDPRVDDIGEGMSPLQVIFSNIICSSIALFCHLLRSLFNSFSFFLSCCMVFKS